MPVHPKVTAGTLAAAVSGVIVWLLGRYVLHGRVDPVLIAEVYAAVPAVLTFIAGWLTPARKIPPAPVAWPSNVTVQPVAPLDASGEKIAPPPGGPPLTT